MSEESTAANTSCIATEAVTALAAHIEAALKEE
jgi:hypothetical protein